MLSNLIEKEKGYRNAENTSENESNDEESSSDIENHEAEEVVSENGVEAEGTQESDNDTENDSQQTESSSPEKSTTFHSKRPCEHCENSNLYWTLIMKCSKCFWHNYYKICPICNHQIPEGRNNIKEGFLRCHDRGAVTHKNAETKTKPISIPLLKRRTKKRINFSNFHPLQIPVYLLVIRFVIFLNKVFNRCVVSDFIASNY